MIIKYNTKRIYTYMQLQYNGSIRRLGISLFSNFYMLHCKKHISQLMLLAWPSVQKQYHTKATALCQGLDPACWKQY